MQKLEFTQYRTINFLEAAELYQEKYDEELDCEDLFVDYCNGAYMPFSVEWASERIEEHYGFEEEDAERGNYVIEKFLQLLLEQGLKEDEEILILLDW